MENSVLRQCILPSWVATPREQGVSCATQMLRSYQLDQSEKNAAGGWPKLGILSQELVHLSAENLSSGKSTSRQILLKLCCGDLEFTPRTTVTAFSEMKTRKQNQK